MIMRKKRLRLRRILFIGILLGLPTMFTTCELEQDLLDDKAISESKQEPSLEKNAYKKGNELLEVSYVIETTTHFLTGQERFSDIDVASMTPKKEKQKVKLKLYENGQISMVIMQKPLKNPIKIPHKTKGSPVDEVFKTVIENNIAGFYNKKGELLFSHAMEITDHSETVNQLMESCDNYCTQEDIGRAVARLQGGQLIDNIEQFMSKARRNGARIVKEDEQFVTMRMSLNQMDIRSTDEVVLMIDKEQNRTAGSKIYNQKDELVLSTLYGYGPPEKPFLTAIKQQSKETLPSGRKVIVEEYSKIDKIKYKANI